MNKARNMKYVTRTALVLSLSSTVLLGSLYHDTNDNLDISNKKLSEEMMISEGLLNENNSLVKENNLLQLNLLDANKELEMSKKNFDALTKEAIGLKKEVKALKKTKVDAQPKIKPKPNTQQEEDSSVPSTNYKNWKKLSVESTGYSTYENGDKLSGRKWGGKTRSGTTPKWGTIAVDPNVIPLGTKVYIPKFDMVFTAEDTGSAIIGQKIDIYFDTVSQANNWGRQYGVEVYVNY